MKTVDLAQVGKQFQTYGGLIDGGPYGSGHINDTFAVVYNQGGTHVRYIHQRLNTNVFKDPVALMDNVARVTEHLRRKMESDTSAQPDGRSDPDITRRTLTVVPARDGRSYYIDEDGGFWRTYIFIEGARTYDVIENTRQAFEAAKAVGEFQRLLADLPGPRLHETIPRFHHTPSRFQSFLKAVEEDKVNRAASAKDEIAFVEQREAITGRLVRLLEDGQLEEWTTHNDTKLNNVMIDDETAEGICVIDLDTVMPGLALYDFGDLVRSATNSTNDDDKDLSRCFMRMDIFQAIVRGYLRSARDALSETERDLMAFSGRLICLENGSRFLADYLQGDVYFKTKRPEHNLDRCRTQFKLVSCMETDEEAMNAYVRKAWDGEIDLQP